MPACARLERSQDQDLQLPRARRRAPLRAAPAPLRREQALASGEPSEVELTEALALWRGEVLSDLAYEGSLRTEIVRLEELRLSAGERLADRRLQRGGHEEALPDLQELVAAEPLRERARGLLMLAVYRVRLDW